MRRLFKTGFVWTALLLTVSAPAQNLFVEVANSDIFEISSGGTVSPTPATGMGAGGLAFDNSGDLYFGNNSDGINELTPNGIQSTLGTAYEPTIFQSLFSVRAVDNNGYVWGFVGQSLYNVSTPTGAPGFVSSSLGPALAINSSGQIFVEGFGPGSTKVIYEAIGPVYNWPIYYNPTVPPVAMTFDGAGDLFELDSFGNIFKITPSGQVSDVADSLNASCLACDNQGDLFVGCNNGDIIEIAPGGSVSTFATMLGSVDGLAFQPVPEPSAFALITLAAAVFGIAATRRKSVASLQTA